MRQIHGRPAAAFAGSTSTQARLASVKSSRTNPFQSERNTGVVGCSAVAADSECAANKPIATTKKTRGIRTTEKGFRHRANEANQKAIAEAGGNVKPSTALLRF